MRPAQHLRSGRSPLSQSRTTSCAVLIAIVLAALAGACTSSSISSTSPTFQKCAVTLGGLSGSVAAGGGSAKLAVDTAPECTWTVSNNTNWLSISPMSGQGSGEVTVQIAANQAATTRQGDVVINGQHAIVRQDAAPCQFGVSPQSIAANATAGSATVSVGSASACAWTAVSNAPWITVSGSSGSGNGQVTLTFQANTGAARTGTATIAGQTVTVNQGAAGALNVCTFAISVDTQSFGVNGGNGTAVNVTAAAGCAWTAVSNAPWITVTSGASGTGNGTVRFTVAANSGGARTGTLTIAGQTLTVNQAGAACPSSINPVSQVIGAGGGNGTSISVSADNSCTWTAVSNDPWLTIGGNPTHSGNGSVSFTVAANTGSPRTGTITIGAQTFTVTQSAGCAFAVSPLSETVDADKGPGQPIAVTTSSSCSWTATTSTSWISITSGRNGTGNGTVEFSVDKFNGNQRTGSLTVAGQTVTITQRK